MNIAIIGVGNVGGGLAAAATRAGHDVVLSAEPASAAQENGWAWQSGGKLVGPQTAAR